MIQCVVEDEGELPEIFSDVVNRTFVPGHIFGYNRQVKVHTEGCVVFWQPGLHERLIYVFTILFCPFCSGTQRPFAHIVWHRRERRFRIHAEAAQAEADD